MDTSKLRPNDPRVKNETAQIRGKTYNYYVGEPNGTPIETMLLIHGWPDMSFGWRYQVPYFMSLGFRVIIPDMIGYAGTDAPQDLSEYTLKSSSMDMKELVAKYVGENGQIVLGGHDWGGMVIWRMVEWFPETIKCVFSICTPYTPLTKDFVDLETVIASGKLTNFTYQLQLAGPVVEKEIQGEEKIRQFMNGLYEGTTPEGKALLTVKHGVRTELLPHVGPAKLATPQEIDYYVQQYMRREAPQMRGPLNWYRTRKLNHEESLPLAAEPRKIQQPALFIAASKDTALPPSMSTGMERHFTDLTRHEVNAAHFAHCEAADTVNQIIGQWLQKALGQELKASL